MLIALPVNKEEMTKNHWFTVKITFNLKQNEVRLRVHDSEKICTGVYLTESFKPGYRFWPQWAYDRYSFYRNK